MSSLNKGGELTSAKEKLEEAEKNYKDAEQALKDTNTALTNAKSNVTTKEQELTDAKADVQTKETALTTAQNNLTDLQSQLEIAKANTADYTDEAGNLVVSEEVQNLTSAVETKTAEVNTLYSEYTTALSAQDLAKSEYNNALSEELLANESMGNAETDLANANSALTSAQTTQIAAQSEYDTVYSENKGLYEQRSVLETELKNANTAVENATTSVSKAEVAVAQHTTDVTNANTALETANSELEEAQKIYNDNVTAEADSAIGFYKSLGTTESEEALRVFEYYNNLCDTETVIDYLGNEIPLSENAKTETGNRLDAISLVNMMASLDYIDQQNEIRKSEGLRELKITTVMMAIAQANANHAALTINHWGEEYVSSDGTEIGAGCSENIAYENGDTVDVDGDYGDPFDSWYTIEKTYVQWRKNYMKEHSVTDENDSTMIQAAIEAGVYPVGSSGSTGHYTNIVDSWSYYIGYAISRKDKGNYGDGIIHLAKMSNGWMIGYTPTDTYTVDEYRTLLQSYIDTINGYKTALSDAKKNAETKKAAYDILVADESVTKALTEAKQALSDAETLVSQKTSELADLKNKIAASDTAVEKAKTELDNAKTATTTAESNVTSKKEALNSAKDFYDKKVSATAEKKSAYDEAIDKTTKALSAYTTANTDKKNAEADLKNFRDTARALVDELNEKITKQNTTIETAKTSLEKAKKKVTTKETELATAKTNVETATSNVEKAKSKVEETKSAYETAKSEYHKVEGHKWNTGEVTTEPTCTDKGVKTYKCTECGETKTEEVEALGHSYSEEWTIDVQPTLTTEGSKSHHCTRCNAKTDVLSVDKLSFLDVNDDTDHLEDINWLAGSKISTGWIEGNGTITFRPYNEVARADMAAFLQRLGGNVFGDKEALEYAPTEEDWNKFTDVSEEGDYHQASILWLANNEITKGWEDGTFRPENSVTRADMAAFIRRLAKKYEIGDAATWAPTEEDWATFSDVIEGEDYHQADILWLYHAGISTGWEESDGTKTYRPFETVKRCDMAAFLQRLANLG